MTFCTSCQAAPVLLVTTPMHWGTGGEKALGVQLFVQSVKGHLGRTGAKGLHIIYVQLERTVPLVNGGVAVGQHQHAVLRLEVKQLGRITEHHAFYAGGLVL